MTLPNFIAIGPGKTGTTWLYQCLLAHPDVSLARNIKETFFFNDYYDRGLDWYSKFFDAASNAKAVGEISNTYFFNENAPARIGATLPHAKLIAFLRNPTDRLVSLYMFRRRNGWITGSIENAVEDDPSLVSQNFFDEHLERYFTYFPREQILIALFDDLAQDPELLFQNVCRFLEIDPTFRPPELMQRTLPASAPRNPPVFHALKRFALWLRHNDMHGFLTWAKTNPVLMGILTRPAEDKDRPDLSPAFRKHLAEIYKPHIERTAKMIGRDLSAWLA